MAKGKGKTNLQRVQFPKTASASEIYAGIKKIQDEWAKRNPARAHRLYPDVFDESGNRITKTPGK